MTDFSRIQSKAVKETEEQIQDLVAWLLDDLNKNYENR